MKRLPIISVLLLALVLTVYAAWTATDDFDCQPDATALVDSPSCGSGWSDVWTLLEGGTATYATAPAGGQGGRAASTSVSTTHQRTLTTAISAGTVRFLFRTTDATPAQSGGVSLGDGSGTRMFCKLQTDGNLKIFNGTSGLYDVTVLALSANTWYEVDLEWDDAAQDNLYRARAQTVGGALGTWTAWTSTNSSYTTISKFNLSTDNIACTMLIDDIEATPATAFPAYYYRMMSQQ